MAVFMKLKEGFSKKRSMASTATRLKSERKWGRDAFLDSQPIVVGNSIPKAGSHLLDASD